MWAALPDSRPADAGKLPLINRAVIKCTSAAVEQKQCIPLRPITAAADHAPASGIYLQQFAMEEKYCYWLLLINFSLSELRRVSPWLKIHAYEV